MKILALIASPRKMGNTDLLVEQFLAGAKTRGCSTKKLYLYDYTIALCNDCRNCKKGDYLCCIKDEMQQIYPLMEEADLIVFGTPIYWYGPSAKMKMLIDRLRPYVEGKKLRGKKAVIVSPSAEGPVACEPMLKMFRKMFIYLKMELAGTIFVKAYNKGEISEDKEELEKVYMLGATLCK
jgi:multimeric flavodoxin WrbA